MSFPTFSAVAPLPKAFSQSSETSTMVNPGAFRGSRFDFLMTQKPTWTRAVEEGHTKEALLLIQRRYFKRYPVDLPHDVEPSAEHLASVDDDAPDVEDNSVVSTEQLVQSMTGFPLQTRGEVIRYRKDQIHRWLEYQYTKDNDTTSKKPTSNNPYGSLLSMLTKKDREKPRKKSAANTWRTGAGPRAAIEKQFQLELNKAAKNNNIIPTKNRISMRDAIARKLFSKLPKAEQDKCEEQALEDSRKAKDAHESSLKGEASTNPEDRQRAIQTLPQFVMPILDFITEATGWKATLIVGGSEPARGGQLSVMSIHSGTTSGDIPMNFGQLERERYKEHIVPIYGKFLKKCYTPTECRSRAIPRDSGMVPVSELEPGNEDEPHASGTDPSSTFIHSIDTTATIWDPTHARTIDINMTDNDSPFPFIETDEDGWPPSVSTEYSPTPSPVMSPRITPEPETNEENNGVQLRRHLPPPSLIISPHGFVEFSEHATQEERHCPILVLPQSHLVTSGGYTTIHPPPPNDGPLDPAQVFENTPYFMRENAHNPAMPNTTPAPPLPGSVVRGIIQSALASMPLSHRSTNPQDSSTAPLQPIPIDPRLATTAGVAHPGLNIAKSTSVDVEIASRGLQPHPVSHQPTLVDPQPSAAAATSAAPVNAVAAASSAPVINSVPSAAAAATSSAPVKQSGPTNVVKARPQPRPIKRRPVVDPQPAATVSTASTAPVETAASGNKNAPPFPKPVNDSPVTTGPNQDTSLDQSTQKRKPVDPVDRQLQPESSKRPRKKTEKALALEFENQRKSTTAKDKGVGKAKEKVASQSSGVILAGKRGPGRPKKVVESH